MIAACAAVALVAPLLAGAQGMQGMKDDPDKLQKAGSTLPVGWKARLDNGSTEIAGVNLMQMNGGLHFVTGPAGIYYRPTDQASGAYEVHATFKQMAAATHPEAYGLFIGGSNLDGPDQKYLYFLVRQGGMFLVKRRAGTATPTINDWTASPSVKPLDASGQAVNTLSIDVGKDKVRFIINGTEVSSVPRAQADADGIVGLRVNHNLNVSAENFGLKK